MFTSQLIGAITLNTLLFIIMACLNRKRVSQVVRTGRTQPRDTQGRFAERIIWVTDFKGIV